MEESPYEIRDGILYSRAQIYPRLMLLKENRQLVLQRCHGDVGHQSFYKTLARVQEAYVWPGMRATVREHVGACPLCMLYSQRQERPEAGQMPVPPRPHHTWGIDLTGPFPISNKGNKYLLTIIDHLTGWGEAIPIKDKTNDSVWEAFNREIIARYGVPTVVLTDQGGEFTAIEWERWLAA